MTAELLVCDSASGNILRCSSIDGSCTVLVNKSSLVLPDGQTADGKGISVAGPFYHTYYRLRTRD